MLNLLPFQKILSLLWLQHPSYIVFPVMPTQLHSDWICSRKCQYPLLQRQRKLPGHGKHLAILHADPIPNVVYIRLVNKPDVICPWDFHILYWLHWSRGNRKMSLIKTQAETKTVMWVERFSLQISKKNHGGLERQGEITYVRRKHYFTNMVKNEVFYLNTKFCTNFCKSCRLTSCFLFSQKVSWTGFPTQNCQGSLKWILFWQVYLGLLLTKNVGFLFKFVKLAEIFFWVRKRSWNENPYLHQWQNSTVSR